jgi:hypothetical protein
MSRNMRFSLRHLLNIFTPLPVPHLRKTSAGHLRQHHSQFKANVITRNTMWSSIVQATVLLPGAITNIPRILFHKNEPMVMLQHQILT